MSSLDLEHLSTSEPHWRASSGIFLLCVLTYVLGGPGSFVSVRRDLVVSFSTDTPSTARAIFSQEDRSKRALGKGEDDLVETSQFVVSRKPTAILVPKSSAAPKMTVVSKRSLPPVQRPRVTAAGWEEETRVTAPVASWKGLSLRAPPTQQPARIGLAQTCMLTPVYPPHFAYLNARMLLTARNTIGPIVPHVIIFGDSAERNQFCRQYMDACSFERTGFIGETLGALLRRAEAISAEPEKSDLDLSADSVDLADVVTRMLSFSPSRKRNTTEKTSRQAAQVQEIFPFSSDRFVQDESQKRLFGPHAGEGGVGVKGGSCRKTNGRTIQTLKKFYGAAFGGPEYCRSFWVSDAESFPLRAHNLSAQLEQDPSFLHSGWYGDGATAGPGERAGQERCVDHDDGGDSTCQVAYIASLYGNKNSPDENGFNDEAEGWREVVESRIPKTFAFVDQWWVYDRAITEEWIRTSERQFRWRVRQILENTSTISKSSITSSVEKNRLTTSGHHDASSVDNIRLWQWITAGRFSDHSLFNLMMQRAVQKGVALNHNLREFLEEEFPRSFARCCRCPGPGAPVLGDRDRDESETTSTSTLPPGVQLTNPDEMLLFPLPRTTPDVAPCSDIAEVLSPYHCLYEGEDVTIRAVTALFTRKLGVFGVSNYLKFYRVTNEAFNYVDEVVATGATGFHWCYNNCFDPLVYTRAVDFLPDSDREGLGFFSDLFGLAGRSEKEIARLRLDVRERWGPSGART